MAYEQMTPATAQPPIAGAAGSAQPQVAGVQAAAQPVDPTQPYGGVKAPKGEKTHERAVRLFTALKPSLLQGQPAPAAKEGEQQEAPQGANPKVVDAVEKYVTKKSGWMGGPSKSFLAAVDAYREAEALALKYEGNKDPSKTDDVAKAREKAAASGQKIINGMLDEMKLPKDSPEREDARLALTEAVKSAGIAEAKNDLALEKDRLYAKLTKTYHKKIEKLSKAAGGDKESQAKDLKPKLMDYLDSLSEQEAEELAGRVLGTSADTAQKVSDANKTQLEKAGAVINEGIKQQAQTAVAAAPGAAMSAVTGGVVGTGGIVTPGQVASVFTGVTNNR